MKIEANAKINLCLDVVGKREDGYHELDMIMLPLALHDEITIHIAQEDEYHCSDESLIIDESNTIVRAVELMRSTYDVKEHFAIFLDKKIPAQAGLAGGSADGAALMRAINELCGLHIPISELASLGKEIGADVPFCVQNQCAIVKGIGERLEPFKLHKKYYVLLVKPNQGVSTKEAFQMLDFTKCAHPHSEDVKHALLKEDLSTLARVTANSLEYTAFRLVPEIKAIKEELLSMQLPVVLMSGSGSSVFAMSEDANKIHEVAQYFKQKKCYYVCETSII